MSWPGGAPRLLNPETGCVTQGEERGESSESLAPLVDLGCQRSQATKEHKLGC